MTKAEFCKSLGWSLPIAWYDLTGICSILGQETIAKVELAQDRFAGEFEGFQVSIVNKKTGLVDSKYFRFDDYLDRARRKDPSSSEPTGKCYYAYGSSTFFGWRIAEPANTSPFTNAVEDYIAEFQVT